MRELESAVKTLAVALSEFRRAVNEEYRLHELTLRSDGKYFPGRIAENRVRYDVNQILAAGGFSAIQEAAILGAIGAWQPPTKKEAS